MTTEQLFAIAKILDNEYIGKEKTFTAMRHRSCWHLSTNICDMASLIRVWERDNKINSIEIVGPDSEGWAPITSYSWARVEKYLESLNIPPSHSLTCPTCGKTIDKRDLEQVLAHGQYNEMTGKYECHEPVDVPYDTSKKVGDSVEWTKDKRKIDLN